MMRMGRSPLQSVEPSLKADAILHTKKTTIPRMRSGNLNSDPQSASFFGGLILKPRGTGTYLQGFVRLCLKLRANPERSISLGVL